MSQTSVVKDTATERFILDISTWWTKADVQSKDGPERRTDTASQDRESTASLKESQSTTHRTQITLSSDILLGVGAQFMMTRIHCHDSHSSHSLSSPDSIFEVRMTVKEDLTLVNTSDKIKASTNHADAVSIATPESSHNVSAKSASSKPRMNNEEKIIIDTKQAEATIETS